MDCKVAFSFKDSAKYFTPGDEMFPSFKKLFEILNILFIRERFKEMIVEFIFSKSAKI
jgi:hypothetical protein